MSAPAPSPAEQAVIDRFGIYEAEERVEKVARAIWESEPGTMPWEGISELTRSKYRLRAPAVIAAMPTSRAVEAVNPLDFINPHVVNGDQFGNGWNMALRFLAQRRVAIAGSQNGEAGQ